MKLSGFFRIIALTLILIMCTTAMPDAFIDTAAIWIQTSAKAEEKRADATVVTDVITGDSGWIYQLCADGNAEILGYTDASAEKLEIPLSIDSYWVTRIGENAFAENAALLSVFIPGTVIEIQESAFPGHTALTIEGWNGSCGMEYAKERDFDFVNKSQYDFFDHIIDLSELKTSQWGLSGDLLRISDPFDGRIEIGTDLFIPSCSKYENGMPVSITAADEQDGYTLFQYEFLDFISSVESYREEDIALIPDMENIVFLEEGFSLASSGGVQARAVEHFDASLNRKIDVSYDINDYTTLSGSITWKPSIHATVDYSNFKINEFSYTNTTTSEFELSLEVDGSQKLVNKKDTKIDFAEVPLLSFGVVTAYARLSVVIDFTGTASMEITLMSTEYFNYNAKTGVENDKTTNLGNVDFSVKGEFGLSMELALAVCLGFSGTQFKIDVAEVSVEYGLKLEVTATITSDYSDMGSNPSVDYGDTAFCMDIDPKIVFSMKIKIGAFAEFEGIGKLSAGLEFKPFDIEETIGRLWHIESDHGLVDECTRGVCRVRFYSGSGYTPPDQLVDKGAKVTKPTNPTRDGYTFDRWYKEKELKTEWKFNTDVVTENTVLYAGWINPVGELEYLEDNNVADSADYLTYAKLTFRYDEESGSSTPLEEHVYCIDGWIGNPKHLVIPEKHDGLDVTSLGCVLTWWGVFSGYRSPFNNCKTLETIIIPDSVTTIVPKSFYNCSNLRSVTLSGNLERIGKNTFTNCTSLKEITIPEGVTSIEDYAFSGCTSLESITLPSTLKSIGASAFQGCKNLEYINLPAGLESIGNNAFENCTSLTSITLPANLKTLGNSSFKGCTSLFSARVTVSPGNYCFQNCTSLSVLTFTGGVSSIGQSAFNNCDSLEKVVLPKTIVSIGSSAFKDCDQLHYASMWANPGSNAFESCDLLDEVYLYEGITEIGSYAFRYCKNLSFIELPLSLETIGSNAFYECDLFYVDIPQSVKTINGSAFAYNKELTTLTIGTNVETLTSNIISGVDKSYFTILTVRGCAADQVFKGSTYSSCIEYISANEYLLTLAMNGGYLPEGYTRYNEAGYCITLWDDPIRPDYIFTGWYRDEACTVPWNIDSDVMPYANLTLYAGWKPLPEGLVYETVYLSYAQEYRAYITAYMGGNTELEIPAEINGFPVIGVREGAIPAGVDKVYLPSSITSIADGAFSKAADLLEIAVDSKNTYFTSVDGVLYKKTSGKISSLVVYPRAKAADNFTPESGITAIQPKAFYGTSALKEVILPGSVKDIKSNAFENSQALTSIIVPEGVTRIRTETFKNCPLLQKIELPSSLKYLEHSAFLRCRSLEKVVFKADPSSEIPENCFEFCGTLSDLYIYGPLNAPNLTKFADSQKLNYNEYAVTYVVGDEIVAIVTERAGTKLAVPPSPTSEEQSFIGWSLEENGDIWDFANDLMPQEHITLYAVIQYDFTCTNVEGGVRLVKYIGNEQEIRVPASIDGKDVVSIADDCFSGKTVKKLIGNYNSVVEDFARRKGYAFEAIEYTITYNANGGYFPTIGRDVCENTNDGNSWGIYKAKRTNYTFTGWYLDKACTEPWDEEFPFADITVYAGWKKSDESIEDIPFEYRIDDGSVYITGYTGNKTTVEIPSMINSLSVVGIDDFAFYGNQVMFNVSIPASVKTIGDSAFRGSRIATVTFTGGLVSLGSHAFADCRELASLKLPASLAEAGSYAFSNCSSLMGDIVLNIPVISEGMFSGCNYLGKIILDRKVEKVCDYAFINCTTIKEFIVLSSKLSEIPANAFDGCTSLLRFTVDASNPYYKVNQGALFTKDGTTLVRIGEGAVKNEFSIPSGVLTIGEGAMKGSRINKLILNKELISLEKDALRNSYSLKNIVFAQNGKLNSIEESAFANCRSLKKLDLPESLTSIKAKAFSNCNLEEIRIAKNTVLVENCIPAVPDLTIFGFSNTSAAEYAKAKGIRFIDLENDIPVESITLPSYVVLEIGKKITLATQFLPANTTEKTLSWVSEDPSIVSVTDNGELFPLRKGETMVTATAQNGSTAVCCIYVTDEKGLPTGIDMEAASIVLNIGESRTFKVLATAENNDYKYVEEDVENDAIVKFQNNSYNGRSSKITALKTGRTQITFTTYNGITAVCEITVVKPFAKDPELVLPSALKTIDAEAFAYCTFSSVKCPNNLIEIGEKAFVNSAGLTQIFIPKSVNTIGADAFKGCNDLMIYGYAGSEAERYANNNNIPFVPCN